MESIFIITLFMVCLSPLVLSIFFKSRKSKKTALIVNIASCVVLVALTFTVGVSASETVNEVPDAISAGMTVGDGLGLLGAALVTGLSCVGAGIAVASSASAAIGAISENPSAFGKALIFVALAEGVALYGLLISIQILAKI